MDSRGKQRERIEHRGPGSSPSPAIDLTLSTPTLTSAAPRPSEQASHNYAALPPPAQQRLGPPASDDAMQAEPFVAGKFSGTYESGPKRNWADLHVVGATGGSLNIDDLISVFTMLYQKMQVNYKQTDTIGTLEWHPTGAVVTKQIVELLGNAVGGWWHWGKALYAQKERQAEDARKKHANPDNDLRNKLDGKLAPEIVPEHMEFLRSLKGAKGLSIAAGGGIAPPEGIRELPTVEQQIQALDQSMIDETPKGDARLAQYEHALNDPDAPGPSLKIN